MGSVRVDSRKQEKAKGKQHDLYQWTPPIQDLISTLVQATVHWTSSSVKESRTRRRVEAFRRAEEIPAQQINFELLIFTNHTFGSHNQDAEKLSQGAEEDFKEEGKHKQPERGQQRC